MQIARSHIGDTKDRNSIYGCKLGVIMSLFLDVSFCSFFQLNDSSVEYQLFEHNTILIYRPKSYIAQN